MLDVVGHIILVLFCVTWCDRHTEHESTSQEIGPLQHTHQLAAG